MSTKDAIKPAFFTLRIAAPSSSPVPYRRICIFTRISNHLISALSSISSHETNSYCRITTNSNFTRTV